MFLIFDPKKPSTRRILFLCDARRADLVTFSPVRLNNIRAALIPTSWTRAASRSAALTTCIWAANFDFGLRISRCAHAFRLDHTGWWKAPAETVFGQDPVSAAVIGVEWEIFAILPTTETAAERTTVHSALNGTRAHSDRVVGGYFRENEGR